MMTYEDKFKYFRPAAANLFPECSDLNEREKLLATELGIRKELRGYFSRRASNDPEMTEELKQILVKLAGPYGKAYLQVIKAQGSLDPKITRGKPK